MMKLNQKYHILYGIMFAVVLFMIVWISCHYKGASLIEEAMVDTIAFEEGWTAENGDEVTLKRLNKLEGVEAYQEFSVYNTLPEDLEEGNSLCFRSKNVYYAIYIEGELLYEPYVPQSAFYVKSYGTRWNYVKIPSYAAGKQIEIRVTTVYDDSRASLDHIYLGNTTGVILDTIQGKLVSFVTCILLLFVGLLLIVADIPINMQSEKNHELMYLGLFAVSIAVWCVTETNLLQFFINDSRMIKVISCCSLMMIPIPAVLYLDAAFGFRKKCVVPLVSILSFLEFAACMLLHFTKIADFHETLKLTHIVLAVTAVVLFYTIIRNSFFKSQSQTKNIYRILRGIGLSGISIATVIDIIRFYLGSGNDTAMFVRIGLLIFVVCYGSSSLEKTVNAVKLGIQTEFVSQLAYRDGLTGIGNRTAFQEHLIDLEKIKDTIPAVAIIMFDVNDLKYVNDHLGHHLGDQMLVKSAGMIKEAFESLDGECFRIGGDEFAVLISGEEVNSRCEEGIGKFRELMKAYNEEPGQLFHISIAYGYALYSKETADKKLMDIYQKADMLMYENKKAMKESQSTPEEFYSKGLA